MPDVELQENTLNGRSDTILKVLCSPSKLPLIIDQSRTNVQVLLTTVAE